MIFSGDTSEDVKPVINSQLSGIRVQFSKIVPVPIVFGRPRTNQVHGNPHVFKAGDRLEEGAMILMSPELVATNEEIIGQSILLLDLDRVLRVPGRLRQVVKIQHLDRGPGVRKQLPKIPQSVLATEHDELRVARDLGKASVALPNLVLTEELGKMDMLEIGDPGDGGVARLNTRKLRKEQIDLLV
ncbi:hypothetical protein D3C87_954070 [compost metagenome]